MSWTTAEPGSLQALSASQTAPNRAVKRRVRQRLHKKPGNPLVLWELDRGLASIIGKSEVVINLDLR